MCACACVRVCVCACVYMCACVRVCVPTFKGSVQYVKDLKKAMVAADFETELILGEQTKGSMAPVLEYKNDTEFMDAFKGVGLHYPCTAAALHGAGAELRSAGKVVYSSEDQWSEAGWGGAACWAGRNPPL